MSLSGSVVGPGQQDDLYLKKGPRYKLVEWKEGESSHEIMCSRELFFFLMSLGLS